MSPCRAWWLEGGDEGPAGGPVRGTAGGRSRPGRDRGLEARDILRAARVLRPFLPRTPLERSAPLSSALGGEVFLKLETVQPTGSFKVRGALNKILTLSPEERVRGVVTASAGNHALGVAHAARLAGIRQATLVLPEAAPRSKVSALKRYGFELVQAGTYDDAEALAHRLEREGGLTCVHSYNDPDVVAGQGTIALEVLEELPAVDTFLVPVGGGGLACGVALWAKAVDPAIRVIGVQPETSPAVYASRRAGRIVQVPILPSAADGLVGNLEPDALTFPLLCRYVDDLRLVREEEILEAIGYLVAEHGIVVEGAGAVSVAALRRKPGLDLTGRTAVLILSGRNIDRDRLGEALARFPSTAG